MIIFFIKLVISKECLNRFIQETSIDVNTFNFQDQEFLPTTNEILNGSIIGANQYNTVYTLPVFSLTTLYFDFAHLYNFSDGTQAQFNYSKDWELSIYLNQVKITNPYTFVKGNDSKMTTFEIKLFVFAALQLSVEVQILNNLFYSEKYQFMNTTKITNLKPNTAIYNTSKIFGIVVSSGLTSNTPTNIIPLDESGNYYNYISSYINLDSFKQNVYTTEKSPYWGEVDQVIVPYLPYFSNCQGYGQYTYLYELMQHENCTLYTPSETTPINPFAFGSKSVSDYCDSIVLKCMVDEVYNSNPQNMFWFQQQQGNAIFDMIADPLDEKQYNVNFQLSVNEQVSILIENSIPSGKMPLQVVLNINYYQMDASTKRIISGSLEFNNFYTLSSAQQSGNDMIYYDLVFNFQPLSQADLVNSFALQWPVYLILYMIIGTILVIEVALFLLYHYVLNRRRPRPSIKFLDYLIIWPEAIYGAILSQLPFLSVYILITVIMSGFIWTTDTNYACSWLPPTLEDPDCGIVLFDYFKNGYTYASQQYQNIRSGRAGLAILVCTFYVIWILSYTYIPKKDESLSYNGNIQLDDIWKKGRIFYCSFVIMTLLLLLVQFSFTNLFANNAYYFLLFNKVSQMIIEYILETYFDDNFIGAPFAISVNIYVNVATMGNPTFYAFLLSTVIDKGVEMAERAYIVKVQSHVTEELENYYEKTEKVIRKFLNEKEEEDPEDAKIQTSERKIINEQEDDDDSDSDIIFSDAYKENLASDDESDKSDQLSDHEDQSFIVEVDELEIKFKDMIKKKNEAQYNKENEKEKEKFIEIEKSKEEKSQDDDDEDKSDFIDYFTNFSNDLTSLLYLPFMTLGLWLFYQQSQVMNSYQVFQSQFIYYFLWNIVQIPFQVVLDILGYNLIEQYHEINFLGYIRNCKQRFDNRKTFWKGEEKDSSLPVEKCFQRLDQWCYSSQYYFITMSMVCSLCMGIVGAETIYVNQYNLFYDSGMNICITLAFVFIVIFWVVMCYLLHQLYRFIGTKLKIWQIHVGKVYPEEIPQALISIEEFDTLKSTNITKLQINKWEKALHYRDQQERLSEINNNLDQEQFRNDQFRKLFINSNKFWLRDNLKSILSPRTLKDNRKIILDKFSQIYGPIDKKNDDDPVSGFDNTWNFKTYNKPTVMLESKGQKYNKKFDQLPSHSVAILRYWVQRTRQNKNTIKWIAGLLEGMTRNYCDYCGLNWGLSTETEQRIEDVYLKFLQVKRLQQVTEGKQIDDWQNFFSKQTKFRTVCFVCNGLLIQEIMKDKINAIQEQKTQQQNKKVKFHFVKIAKIILVWVKFYRYVTENDKDSMS